MTTTEFPLSVMLSITTGRLVCPIDEVYTILNHMTGDSLMTHQLPRAQRWAAPLLEGYLPKLAMAREPVWLARLDTLLADAAAGGRQPQEACRLWAAWLKEAGMSETYAVQGPLEGWQQRHPIAELLEMMETRDEPQ